MTKQKIFRKKLYKMIFSCVVIISFFILIFFVGFQYVEKVNKYKTVFFNHTTINGVDVSGLGIDEAYQLLKPDMDEQYSLEVIFKNGVEILSNGEGSLEISLCESLNKILTDQNEQYWFSENSKIHDIIVDYEINYDRELLTKYIDSFSYMQDNNMKPPVNATVTMDNGEVNIIPETPGTKLDRDKVHAVIFEALDKGLTQVNLEEYGCYAEPSIVSDDEVIKNMADEASAFLDLHCVYNVGGDKIVISREELSKLGYINSKGSVSISKYEVDNYVRKLDSTYFDINAPEDNREFVTQDGKIISFYCGKSITKINTDKEAVYLFNLLTEGDDFERSPILTTVSSGMNKGELGEQYVEVNLTRQHVYLISDGEVIFDTPCVTGNVPSYQSTPSGIYKFNYKKMDVTLRGQTYESYVNYWMPFYGNFGLHDATWRDEFGDEIYLTSGSHGCVNLPIDAAERIYDFVNPGMTIVLYWE